MLELWANVKAMGYRKSNGLMLKVWAYVKGMGYW